MSIILWVLSVFTDLAIWEMDFHISLESVLCPIFVYCAITDIQISILCYVAIAPEPREIIEALVLWGHKPKARIKLPLRLHTSWSMPQILTYRDDHTTWFTSLVQTLHITLSSCSSPLLFNFVKHITNLQVNLIFCSLFFFQNCQWRKMSNPDRWTSQIYIYIYIY